jgi:predicted Zn finger-like uncharacterized protein
MILTCPNCGTQYVVKDGAIPPQGRQVRCAACKHSWHQNPEDGAQAVGGEEIAAEPESPFDDDRSEAPDEEGVAEATLIEPRSGPEAEERAYEESLIEEDEAGLSGELDHNLPAESVGGEPRPAQEGADWDAPPGLEPQDDEFSPFPAPDEAAPRRRSPWLKLVAIVLIVAALAAAFWFLAPAEWKSRVGLTGTGASPLALVTTHMDRQRLESGNELLTVTGRVINPTSKDQPVPPLQAQLRTRAGQVVYNWTIAPPARSLPPGASARFNSTEVDVPPGGDELTITIGSPKA